MSLSIKAWVDIKVGFAKKPKALELHSVLIGALPHFSSGLFPPLILHFQWGSKWACVYPTVCIVDFELELLVITISCACICSKKHMFCLDAYGRLCEIRSGIHGQDAGSAGFPVTPGSHRFYLLITEHSVGVAEKESEQSHV